MKLKWTIFKNDSKKSSVECSKNFGKAKKCLQFQTKNSAIYYHFSYNYALENLL
jgi:hypothetical protein